MEAAMVGQLFLDQKLRYDKVAVGILINSALRHYTDRQPIIDIDSGTHCPRQSMAAVGLDL